MTQKTTLKEEKLSSLLNSLNISTITNSTSHFLVPTVLLNSVSGKALELDYLKKYGFINAYFDDFGIEPSDFEWYNSKENYLYMLFAPKDYNYNFLEVEGTFKSIKAWVDYYDLDGGGKLIVHVFRIDKVYAKDYRYFVAGEYSKISSKLKDLYINEITLGIINKTDQARKVMGEEYGINFMDEHTNVELLKKINFEEETLRFYDKRSKSE